MKKGLSILLAMILCVFVIAGCSQPAEESPSASQTPSADATASESPSAETSPEGGNAADFTVGVLMKTQNNPYFVDLGNKLKEGLEGEGYNVVGVLNADQSLETEYVMMEQLIAQDVDLIIWNPVEINGSSGAAELVVEPGIPLIGVDTLCLSDALTTTVYSDNPANGYACGCTSAKITCRARLCTPS